MILRLCLVAGVLLNAALALWPRPPVRAASRAIPEVTAPATIPGASDPVSVEMLLDSYLAIPASQRLDWSNLSPDNLAEQVRRLRLAGVPESVLENVIHHRVNQIYESKVKAVVDPIHSSFFDLMAESEGNILNFAKPQQEALSKLEDERGDLLEQLLDDRHRTTDDWDLHPRSQPGRQVLSEEQQEAVGRIEVAFSTGVNSAQRLSPADRAARLADLENQKRAELLWTLGPEKFEEWNLQRSKYADQALSAMAFPASADELRSIVAMYEAADRDTVGTGKQQEKAVADLFQTRFRAAFGEERWAQYSRGRDPAFGEEYLAALAEGLPPETADAIWRVRTRTVEAAERTRSASTNVRDREMQLDAARIAAMDAVARQLGPQRMPSYLKANGGWLEELR